jgi:4-diphosphocytidyl-2-C-methyl-D-erythritol kinase
LRLVSPAKINLFLRILRKRPDGFHELASLFQAIDLFDILTFEPASTDLFTCSDSNLPLNDKNLVIKALNAFRQKTGKVFPLHIHLDKHIPQEAGLGGGSSNAATTLYALNQLAKTGLSNSALIEIGKDLGSDVPFFLSSGSAYCTGRGELMRDVDLSKMTLTLHKPYSGCATPAVFRALNLATVSSLDPEALLASFQKNSPIYINDLETPAFSVNPELKAFQQALVKSGYDNVLMSGSGSTFFGIGSSTLPGLRVSTIKRTQEAWFVEL